MSRMIRGSISASPQSQVPPTVQSIETPGAPGNTSAPQSGSIIMRPETPPSPTLHSIETPPINNKTRQDPGRTRVISSKKPEKVCPCGNYNAHVQWIQCDEEKCRQWLHAKCAGIRNSVEYELLKSPRMQFFCPACKAKNSMNLSDFLNNIGSKMRSIESNDELTRLKLEIDQILPGESVFAIQSHITSPPEWDEPDPENEAIDEETEPTQEISSQSETSSQEFTCEECDVDLLTKETFDRHVLFHSGVLFPHMCGICSRLFDHEKDLTNHIKTFHVRCSHGTCNSMKPMTLAKLAVHLKKAHYGMRRLYKHKSKRKPRQYWEKNDSAYWKRICTVSNIPTK